MHVTVRLFAVLREHAGTGALDLDVPDGARVSDAVDVLRAGVLADLPADACFATAVAREIVPAVHVLQPGDELALVPPVSGGEGRVRLAELTASPLDPEAIRRLVRDGSCGATVVFCGTTRDVPSLEYEAYEDMAVEQLARLAEAIAAQYDLPAVAIAHRTGMVELSEPSIVVAVSAPYREEAFAGARDLLDRVKEKVAIGKKEHPEDGPASWVEGTLPEPE